MGLIFSIIGWLVFGLIVGAIARFLMPGPQPMSWLMTSVLGIAGSIVGGALWNLIFNGQYMNGQWITSTLGAVLLLYIVPKIQAAMNKA